MSACQTTLSTTTMFLYHYCRSIEILLKVGFGDRSREGFTEEVAFMLNLEGRVEY